MKLGQKTVRINITLKMKDYELLACLAREEIFFKITSLAARYVIERVYQEAKSSEACYNYQKGGKQIDLFKPEENRGKDSKKTAQTVVKGGRKPVE